VKRRYQTRAQARERDGRNTLTALIGAIGLALVCTAHPWLIVAGGACLAWVMFRVQEEETDA